MFMSRSALEEEGSPPASSGTRRQGGGFNAVSNARSRRPGTAGDSSGPATSYGRHGGRGGVDFYRPSAGPAAGRPTTTGGTVYSRHAPPSSSGGGESGIGSAGVLPTSAESRSAMLERQRELMKKKMQQRMHGGMVVTRALDGPAGPGSPAKNPQFTPGLRQFSTPKTFVGDERPKESPPKEAAPVSAGAGAERPTSAFSDHSTEEAPVVAAAPSSDRRDSSHGGSTGVSSDFRSRMRDIETRRMEEAKLGDEPSSPDRGTAVERDLAARGLSPTYDPNPSAPTVSRIGDLRRAPGSTTLDFSDMLRFLTSPLPRGAGVVQCYIERDKSGLGKRMYPLYSLYMKQGDRFLLAGKKRAKQKTSNYLISRSPSDLSRDSDSFLGKLRSNFVGTEFVAYDNGINPKDAKKRSNAGKHIRYELASVTYASNVFGSRGPRKMRVHVPTVGPDGVRATFQPLNDKEGLLPHVERGEMESIVQLINKPPKWNEQVGAYVLNFNGRVTMASVKNFQLVTPTDHDTVVLQFGRVGKDLFTMDCQWPLSPLQAFSVCLSSFDYKLACE